MRYNILRWTNFAVIGFIAVSVSNTGCKTGWKMPGADLFGYNRKPSESMIAGQAPSIVTPTSPSSKYDPKAIASTATGGTRSSSSTPAGTTNPITNFATNSGPAQANGFQTGQYRMASTPASGALGAPSQLPQSSMPNANYGSVGMANSYALGTPGTVPTSNPAGSNPGYNYSATTSASVPPAAQTYAGATAAGMYGYQPGSAVPNGMPTNPQLAGVATPPITGYSTASPYVPVSNATGNPTYTPQSSYATQTSPTAYGQPATTYGQPATTYGQPATTYAQPATASISSGGGYRPGSTGRTTSYDLPQSSGTYPATGTSGMTATGSNSPGYVVPPIMR